MAKRIEDCGNVACRILNARLPLGSEQGLGLYCSREQMYPLL